MATKMKYKLKGCGLFGHRTFTSKKIYWNPYHKHLPKKPPFPGWLSPWTYSRPINPSKCHQKRVYPLILEEYIEFMNLPFVKTAGYMIPIRGYYLPFTSVPPSQGFSRDPTLTLSHIYLLSVLKKHLFKNIWLLNNQISPPSLRSANIFTVKL